jgi:hypothetical protein
MVQLLVLAPFPYKAPLLPDVLLILESPVIVTGL